MTAQKLICIQPNWPAPASVKAYSTTRLHGFSKVPFDSFNLSYKVGDDANDVAMNHALLKAELRLPEEPQWLKQVHGKKVVHLDKISEPNIEADACISRQNNKVCAIKTADCLPILLCSEEKIEIAAIHAGWRGLLAGVIETTLSELQSSREKLLAWIGPGISSNYFEINEQIRVDFLMNNPQNKDCFERRNERWFGNLFRLAKNILSSQGVKKIYGDEHCTYQNKELFYSHRRDGSQTGRMASLIWVE